VSIAVAPTASMRKSRALPWRVGTMDWCASSANAQTRQIQSAAQDAARGLRMPRNARNHSSASTAYSVTWATFRSTM